MLKHFEINKSFMCSNLFRYHIKQIDSMLSCVCSVIDHRRLQNVVTTSVTHSAIASCATPSPPSISVFYTLTKIHKGCDGPTEKNILFCGRIATAYRTKTTILPIKDTTDFISFIENTKIGQDTILVAMDVSSLYTNIPQE